MGLASPDAPFHWEFPSLSLNIYPRGAPTSLFSSFS
jgi:hypothetical protein